MNILTAILGRKKQTHPKQEHLRTSREPIVEPFM